MNRPALATTLAHAAAASCDELGNTQQGLHLSTTYLRSAEGQFVHGRIYGRDDNPTLAHAEAAFAAAEGAAAALLFSSGLGAIASLFHVLPQGTSVIVPLSPYYGVESGLAYFAARQGLTVRSVDFADLNQLEAALDSAGAKLVYVETPGNPLLEIADIAAVAQVAHRRGTVVAVDSTVATPVATQPLALGADIVIHSATKYLGGHSDLLGGAVATRELGALWDDLRAFRYAHGNQLSAFDAWLLSRSLQTLDVRMQRISASALAVAQRLAAHPRVQRVLYPGLPSHPGHEVARRQMGGRYSGLLSFQVRGDDEAALEVTRRLRTIKRATSFGGTQTSIEHNASVRALYGARSTVPGNLLRLSVGLEQVDDVWSDLAGALA
jgi:cystathionine gamma-synthase